MHWNNKLYVLKKIKKEPLNLEYASEELKRDKDVVLAAVSNDGTALEYASDDIKSNKEMVLVAVSQNGYALAYASKELKNDKEIVMKAVSNSCSALEYASEQLQNDKELLLILEKDNKRDNKSAIEYFLEWYEDRMDVLQSYREKEIMENNFNKPVGSKLQVKKF